MVDVSDESIELPPGFRFHPTDEEIITHYLSEKVVNISFTARAIGEVDLNKCEPWDLPKRARMGEKEWYFFCQRDRKYPTGMRTNRATEAGYWKATGKDKEIYKGRNCLVGMKKTLVFYTGRAPKGEKTNWVMHEYRLEGKFSYHNLPKTAKDEWVVCRVFHKSTGTKRGPGISGLLGMNSFGDEYYDSPSLPPLTDPPYFNTGRPSPSFIHNNDDNKFNGTTRTSSLLRTTDGHHFSHSTNSEDSNFHQQDKKNFTLSTNYTLASNNSPSTNCYSHTPFSNPFFFSPRSSNSGYLQQEMNSLVPSLRSSGITNPDQAILRALAVTSGTCDSKRQLKVEQFSSNQSMVSLSQDTGLSTDITTEISSMASKHDMGASMPYEDFECPSSAGPVVDLECLWNY